MAGVLMMPGYRPPETWRQRDDEPEDCYLAFLSWLMAKNKSGRAQPPPQLAAAYDWVSRAADYDSAVETPQSADATIAGTIDNMIKLAFLESRKYLRSSELSPMPVLSAREWTTLVAFLKDAHLTFRDLLGAHQEVDLNALSEDQVAALADAVKTLDGLGFVG